MNDRIINALQQLFKKHRIVFWYDAKHELRDDFDSLVLENIEKIVLDNNEFSVKYKIIREQPNQKFLLYRAGAQPALLDNWLLDVQLAHGEFRTDQVAIWLSELSLGIEFAEVLKDHAEFFRAKSRKDALSKLIEPSDSSGMVQLKMLAVCAKSEPKMDTVVESLLQDLANDKDEKMSLISRSALDGFFWEQMNRYYGYNSTEPSIHDFAIELFKSSYAMATDGQVKLSNDALVFLKRWKDSRQYKDSFEMLSDKFSDDLDIRDDLSSRDFKQLIDIDYFRLIDNKIISALANAVLQSDFTAEQMAIWIRQRRQSHWYADFEHTYQALDNAAQFIATFNQVKIDMDSLVQGVERYTQSWYKLDQLYRKFIYHKLESGEVSLLNHLNDKIENIYSNNYLLKLGNRFQEFVESESQWNAAAILRQDNFFGHWVKPFLDNNNKIYVIISDAMRYEIADELVSLIRQEDRYSADIAPMLSMLPSYTQLGMAALLPNDTLSIADNTSGTVLVNGQSSQGTSNRSKILKAALQDRGDAITADNFMQLNREGSRELLKANDVIYIYHNRIDHTGDKMHSEGQAFEAAEKTLSDLMKIIKKLAAANANNILITADHGFIYQNREIDQSDFSGAEVRGKEILYKDRRFILGKGLVDSPGLHKFSSEALGLIGDVEVQIPKSINRLRLSGSGSRFVHGGASLQEVVVPVVSINKKRQSDTTAVEVDILRGSNSLITTEELTVSLYQSTPVTEKNQPRMLRVGVYTESGELISDSYEMTFDLRSENPRAREQQVNLIFTRRIDELNGQEVVLKLEEKVGGTSHYKEYKSLKYTVRRSFTSDFDF
ncbi:MULTISPECIES: BREX-1 system phosphatase PglZ type A [unclassified Psychrobacter]|uniref:BREX-1 system phosphatase PglZ type A n=1 Tax=unclassified Psychrobacter TaxID=196806 RepID=UPI000ED2FF3B|nr:MULTISPECIES: BREX-1 system phosphatase PglZ type A [unclassified Psychrobacter]MBE8608569.1 BREX-1 system phosphatase PglZ type A [Pseudomonas lundensis]HCI75259.1 BREX-1 system phosphatase PglZ type A [Psychrobacter sp.]